MSGRSQYPLIEPPAEVVVSVESVIFSVDIAQSRLLVLLVTRQEPPCLGQWSLPGTLVSAHESLEAAAYRVLSETIQVEDLYLEQLYTFGGPERNLRAGSAGRYLSVSYFALVRFVASELVTQNSAVTWHALGQVPPLAFDHDKILRYGYRRLRNKLEYSPVAFDVLPETFTLGDLYQLYCTVLGDQFSDYSNFRARLLKLGFLTDTGDKVSRGAGRPASLYRFDSEKFAPFKDKPLVFV
ncbi:MAG: NUDIX domain-containing protein [Elainellaceae cyanobacterium]